MPGRAPGKIVFGPKKGDSGRATCAGLKLFPSVFGFFPAFLARRAPKRFFGAEKPPAEKALGPKKPGGEKAREAKKPGPQKARKRKGPRARAPGPLGAARRVKG
jgi:hypothetical protein